ncbi:MAG TPA: bifunctional glutamate N-acetyltransferase/amino-acid acetyltransferase ArgJ [Actinomycetota bacterium]
MSVTFPAGFRAAGITAGLKPSGNPDLAMLVGDPGTTAAGLFTTNRMAAAPVALSRARLALGRARAVVVNSGQANAATGAAGAADADTAATAAAFAADLDPEELLACSTGVIGEPLHVDAMRAAFPALVDALASDGGDAFARAIMTTDTVPKTVAIHAASGLRVGGAAKGVGMISPNLATMLAFLTTDAAVDADGLQKLADEIVKPRFNGFTVDACTSTNDTVLLFASGAAGAPTDEGALASALADAADGLVAQLIADGEGATHVLVIDVEGAADTEAARVVAKAVANSPLVKTAAYGEDPNPGRILQAVGSCGVPVEPASLDLWLGEIQVATGGVIPPAYFAADRALHDAAAQVMQGHEIPIRIRLGEGPGRSRALGCDLSYEYVRINGEYTT